MMERLCAVEWKIKPMAFLTYVDVNDSKHNAYYVFLIFVCSSVHQLDIIYVSQSQLSLSNALRNNIALFMPWNAKNLRLRAPRHL